MLVHELIDHGQGPYRVLNSANASLKHLFFDSKEDADAFVSRYVPRRREEFQYIHREWGPEALRKLWIEDHRRGA